MKSQNRFIQQPFEQDLFTFNKERSQHVCLNVIMQPAVREREMSCHDDITVNVLRFSHHSVESLLSERL